MNMRGATQESEGMRRREFIGLVAAAAAFAGRTPAAAQSPEQLRRLGVLMAYAADDPEARLRVNALESRLRDLDWVIGKSLVIDYRWAPGGDSNALRVQADGLVGEKPDVILCQSTPVLAAVRSESKTTPIIFVQVTDPVGARFVQSLAKPGGRITGFTDFEYGIGGKWLELLKEIAPKVTTAVVIAMAGHAGNAGIFRAMQHVAPSFGIRLTKAELSKDSGLDEKIVTDAASGLIVLPNPVTVTYREAIVDFAARRRLPACYPLRFFAAGGGLMSYGIDQVDQWTKAASYVDRILRGEKAADLPVQQPTKFQMVINLKTSKTLGLTVPPALLAGTDEVIE